MKRKLEKLFIILVISSFLIIAATQRFDKIIAKSIVTTSSSGITLNGGGTLDLATGGLTMASGDLTLTAGDAIVTAGDLTVTAGDLAVTAGGLTAGGDLFVTAQTTISATASTEITPTGYYQPLTSFDLGQTVNDIATPTDDTIGKQLLIHNINATYPITIDGTGATVECKADIELGPQDTLSLLWNGTNWICLSSYDNS